MPSPEHFAEAPADVGVDPVRLEALVQRAGREVRDGLLPSAQLAVARQGKIAAMYSFGHVIREGREAPAANDTIYPVFSTTKAITSAAAWLLIEEKKLDVDARVADLIPEFASNGKEAVRVEHLFTHTAGFPFAPFAPSDWNDPDRRRERFCSWRVEWEPGSRFQYHATSTMWVIADLIERLSGEAFEDFVRRRIAAPLDLPDLRVGCSLQHQARVVDIGYVGAPASAEDLAAVGLGGLPAAEETAEGYLALNRSEVRAIPIPGGGGFMTAGDLALFYQALLAGGRSARGRVVWKPETIRMALRVRSGDLVDPLLHKRANRALGLIVAGDDDRVFRGFGHGCSPEAFGHNGAGGQIAWADPRSGLSFAYCTNGFDRNPIRQARRGVALSSLAATCAG